MKKVCNCIYIHKTALNQLKEEEKSVVNKALVMLEKKYDNVDYQIIKVDLKNNKVSFILSRDWNTSHEPIVGDSYNINVLTNEIKIIKEKKNTQIYHGKHFFVNRDYEGFNVDNEEKRYNFWNSIIPKCHKSRIGYKNYWINLIKKYGIEE